jgi:hypothetical protein
LVVKGQEDYCNSSKLISTGAAVMDYDDLPTDAPGGDCPETGPYADEE